MEPKLTLPPTRDQILALSCTNVGVGPGGTTAMLARVAIVDYKGDVILDTFVAPTMEVSDYRTTTTGIEPSQLLSPEIPSFDRVQQHVADHIKGKTIVGHSLWHDLSVLGIAHPAVATRDVGLYQPFKNALRSPNQVVGLQTLMWHLMRRRCQDGHLHPVENSRAALDLYRTVASEWEGEVSVGNWPCSLPPSSFSRCYL
ncbi:hypothetical protein EDC04DRAFT_2919286 [Pisolithus marmoratus]|nr:hypothetical protein EDC04DRAFT_2919286 [Pisolithus marmoratus]